MVPTKYRNTQRSYLMTDANIHILSSKKQLIEHEQFLLIYYFLEKNNIASHNDCVLTTGCTEEIEYNDILPLHSMLSQHF